MAPDLDCFNSVIAAAVAASIWTESTMSTTVIARFLVLRPTFTSTNSVRQFTARRMSENASWARPWMTRCSVTADSSTAAAMAFALPACLIAVVLFWLPFLRPCRGRPSGPRFTPPLGMLCGRSAPALRGSLRIDEEPVGRGGQVRAADLLDVTRSRDGRLEVRGGIGRGRQVPHRIDSVAHQDAGRSDAARADRSRPGVEACCHHLKAVCPGTG